MTSRQGTDFKGGVPRDVQVVKDELDEILLGVSRKN